MSANTQQHQPGAALRLTTCAIHQSSLASLSGSAGSCSRAMARLTRHSSFFALHLLSVAMYSLRPMPTTLTMSAAWRDACKHEHASTASWPVIQCLLQCIRCVSLLTALIFPVLGTSPGGYQ